MKTNKHMFQMELDASAMVLEKKCTKCGEIKSISEFQKDKSHKDGLSSSCKACCNAADRLRRKIAKHHTMPPKPAPTLPPNTKVCSKCNDAKPLSEFTINKINKDGLESRCRSCNLAATRQWKKVNKAKVFARDKEYRLKHKDIIKEYKKVNKAKLLAQAKEYYKKIKTKSTNTDYKIEINY